MVHGGGYCYIGTKSNDNQFITDECFGEHLGGNNPPFFIILLFVGGACRPTPPPSLFTGSILSWIVPIRLLGCRFHLQTLSLQEKATLKAVWPCCYIYYTSIRIYGYMYIRLYVYTDCLADNSSQDDPLYVALLRQACGPLSCSLRHMSFLAESVALWRNFHHGVSCCPWCPPVHILPSCPSFSFFVRGILGHPSSPKFQGLLSVVSFSIFPTRHMFS